MSADGLNDPGMTSNNQPASLPTTARTAGTTIAPAKCEKREKKKINLVCLRIPRHLSTSWDQVVGKMLDLNHVVSLLSLSHTSSSTCPSSPLPPTLPPSPPLPGHGHLPRPLRHPVLVRRLSLRSGSLLLGSLPFVSLCRQVVRHYQCRLERRGSEEI